MDDSIEIELKNLIGRHKLSGVEISNKNIKSGYDDEYEDCQCISFVIDGKTCTAIEDPEDGYRSSMKEIRVNLVPLKNTFEPVDVICSYKETEDGNDCEILEIRDIKSNKVVLEVGTDNTDDYYPSFICCWMPGNLSINKDGFNPL